MLKSILSAVFPGRPAKPAAESQVQLPAITGTVEQTAEPLMSFSDTLMQLGAAEQRNAMLSAAIDGLTAENEALKAGQNTLTLSVASLTRERDEATAKVSDLTTRLDAAEKKAVATEASVASRASEAARDTLASIGQPASALPAADASKPGEAAAVASLDPKTATPGQHASRHWQRKGFSFSSAAVQQSGSN